MKNKIKKVALIVTLVMSLTTIFAFVASAVSVGDTYTYTYNATSGWQTGVTWDVSGTKVLVATACQNAANNGSAGMGLEFKDPGFWFPKTYATFSGILPKPPQPNWSSDLGSVSTDVQLRLRCTAMYASPYKLDVRCNYKS